VSLVRSAIHGAGWSIAGGYFSQFLSFAMFVVTSRLVGPTAFGAVAVALGLVELCRAFTTESVAVNLIADANAGKRDFNAGFVWTIASTVVVCFVLIWLSPTLATLFKTPALRTVLPQIAILLVCYGASRLQEARMVKTLRFRLLAIRTILAALIGGGVGIWSALHGLGVEALVYQQWAAAGVSVILLWGASDWRPGLAFSRTQFIALQRASLVLAPANLIYGLSVLTDGLAVALLAGPAAAGVYNLGKRVVLAMVMALSSALDRVSLATFAQVQHDRVRLARMLEQALLVSMVLVFPVFVGIAAVSPDLIEAALGEAWKQAAIPTALLLVGGGVGIATSYFENMLLVLQRRRWIVALRVLFVTTLLAGVAFFGRYGPAAIAAMSLCAVLLQNSASAMAVRRLTSFSLRTYARLVGAPFALSLAMLAFVSALRTLDTFAHLPPLQRLGILVLGGATFYAGGAILFARPSVNAVVRAARAAS